MKLSSRCGSQISTDTKKLSLLGGIDCCVIEIPEYETERRFVMSSGSAKAKAKQKCVIARVR